MAIFGADNEKIANICELKFAGQLLQNPNTESISLEAAMSIFNVEVDCRNEEVCTLQFEDSSPILKNDAPLFPSSICSEGVQPEPANEADISKAAATYPDKLSGEVQTMHHGITEQASGLHADNQEEEVHYISSDSEQERAAPEPSLMDLGVLPSTSKEVNQETSSW